MKDFNILDLFCGAKEMVLNAEDVMKDIVEPAKSEEANVWFKLFGLFHDSLLNGKPIYMQLFIQNDSDKTHESTSILMKSMVVEEFEFIENGDGFKIVSEECGDVTTNIANLEIEYNEELHEFYINAPTCNTRWVLWS